LRIIDRLLRCLLRRRLCCRLRRYLGDACVRLSRLADPNCPDPSAVEADLVAWGVRPWRELPDPH